MIARQWHGTTEASKADEYLAFLNQSGIPDYKATRGNRGVFVLRRIEGEQAHFVLISLWDDIDAIKRFAGENYTRARYYPEDARWLLAFEPGVVHFEVCVPPGISA